MGSFFTRIGYSIRRFMSGRHGNDELNRFLSVVALIVMLISLIPAVRWLYILALLILVYTIFRALSRNLDARRKERSWYLTRRLKVIQGFNLFKNRIRDRKTHTYLKCKGCGTVIRIKKPGKGKTIRIVCPRCSHSFTHRT